MPQADIEINAVASSNEDLPINTVVQLSNNDVGDESTYDWSIISQPPGPADALSSLVIENPTLLPQKEDTYLIQLIVDLGLPGESTDRKLFRVRRLKTDAALIATAESTQGTQGAWSFPQNETLNKILNHVYDGDVIVAQAGGPLTAGASVQLDETNTIKTGLPGEERLPRANSINATDPSIASKIVGIVVGKPNGDTVVLANDLVLVRMTGFFDLANIGVPAIGDPVFVNDSGVLALIQGTNRKKMGVVIDDTAGAWRAYLSTLTEEGGPHAIGGGFHLVDSLANINSKVAGGDLDFSTASRPPLGPAGLALAGSYPNPALATPQVVGSAGTTTFSGVSDTLVAGMTITPVAGTYLVFFTGSVSNVANVTTIFTSIYSGGVQAPFSQRQWQRGNTFVAGAFCCMAVVVVNGVQAIEGRWRTNAGTASMYTRNLTLVRIA